MHHIDSRNITAIRLDGDWHHIKPDTLRIGTRTVNNYFIGGIDEDAVAFQAITEEGMRITGPLDAITALRETNA